MTVVTLGPMTNIALPLRRPPDLTSRIRRVVSMGGAYFQDGNYLSLVEFSILVGPEAAEIVLGAGIEMTMVPIDCTNLALTPASWIADLRAMSTEVGDSCAEMQGFFERHGRAVHGTATRSAPARRGGHGLAAMAGAVPRQAVQRRGGSRVGADAGRDRGDWLGQTGRMPSCFWVTGCEAYVMYMRMLERLRTSTGAEVPAATP